MKEKLHVIKNHMLMDSPFFCEIIKEKKVTRIASRLDVDEVKSLYH
jgi:hypothetical protein